MGCESKEMSGMDVPGAMHRISISTSNEARLRGTSVHRRQGSAVCEGVGTHKG